MFHTVKGHLWQNSPLCSLDYAAQVLPYQGFYIQVYRIQVCILQLPRLLPTGMSLGCAYVPCSFGQPSHKLVTRSRISTSSELIMEYSL